MEALSKIPGLELLHMAVSVTVPRIAGSGFTLTINDFTGPTHEPMFEVATTV